MSIGDKKALHLDELSFTYVKAGRDREVRRYLQRLQELVDEETSSYQELLLKHKKINILYQELNNLVRQRYHISMRQLFAGLERVAEVAAEKDNVS